MKQGFSTTEQYPAGQSADRFMPHVYAALAPKARGVIVGRTHIARTAKQAQRAWLGNPTNLAGLSPKSCEPASWASRRYARSSFKASGKAKARNAARSVI